MKPLKTSFVGRFAPVIFSFPCTLLLLISFGCKKNSGGEPQPPVIVDSGTFRVENILKKEINEVDIGYIVAPPAGGSYTNLHLVWSTSADFTTGKDSVAISVTGSQTAVHALKRLQQATRYYTKIGVNYVGKRYYSPMKDFLTDSFKLMIVGYFDPPRGFSKDDTSNIFTNLQPVAPVANSTTKVFFGNYECPLVSDQGLTITFNVTPAIPAGKYKLKVVTRGMEATWPDSVEVLRGQWEDMVNPEIPGNPAASYSALVKYGTCYSNQKGYIVGGTYLNGPPVAYPNSQWPEFLLEFDGQSKTWSKRNVVNPNYFDDPHCYYYNNGIYVIAGQHSFIDQAGWHSMYVKRIFRLDLGSLTWAPVTDVPYPTIFNLASFELNNEFYVGMGADSANRTQCCGTPIPSKKFWKYNPASNQWTSLADFPGGHQNFPTCFSVNGKGYAFYGSIPVGDPNSTLDFTRELWEYDPIANQWTNIPLPATGGPPQGEKYQVTVYNGKAYFISAQKRIITGLGYQYMTIAPCLEWDPVTNVYKTVAFPYNYNILKAYYKQGNTFYYQSQATGYYQSSPFRALKFSIEQ